MEAIQKIKRGNYTLKIYQDEDPQNPRTEWDNVTKMICFHNRYSLGDKHEYSSSDFSGWDEMEKQLIKDFDPVIIQPLMLYDHSGISISTSSFIGRAQHAEWDSGQVGFILVSRKELLSNYGKKRITPDLKEKAANWIKGDVETYDQYLSGDVYGFRLIQKVDGVKEEIDSCWGFYGSNWEENGIKDHLPEEFVNYKEEPKLEIV